MATVAQKTLSFLGEGAERRESVGSTNPIELPLISIRAIGDLIGDPIARGQFGTVHQVKRADPPRVYKILRRNLANGDEVRISQIAAECGVAPRFHGAALVEHRDGKLVAFEMDYAGKSLYYWMEHLAENSNIEQAAVAKESLDAEKQAMKQLEEKEESEDGWCAIALPVKKRIKIEAAAEMLFGSTEKFYFKLFSNIKQLAERNVGYIDVNASNLIPQRSGQEPDLQFVDFDEARLLSSPKDAVEYALSGIYNRGYLSDFKKTPQLSRESLDLISWFKEQLLS